ncbi:MAG: hypothetical protein LAO79_27165 [Acidobacteriia bacterium]|nr:hypothetical protein [Terriglobia bacterium]
MKTDDQTLQLEITIAPAKGRKGGRRGGPAEPTVPDPPRLPRLARLMALAIKFQDMVDRGEVRDYADLARLGYVSRARITQIMNLLNLAPDIQEELLIPSPLAAEAVPERGLRHVTAVVGWSRQRKLWKDLLGKPSSQQFGEGDVGSGRR